VISRFEVMHIRMRHL